MNSRSSGLPAAPVSARSTASRVPRAATLAAATGSDLVWVHDGVRHRVTSWPDVVFARETAPGCWEACDPSEGALASATLGVGAARWRRYLDYVPAMPREFLLRFEYSRMAALLVVVRCPEILGELLDTPALTAFLSAHHDLRGGAQPAWAGMAAVVEREGVFGLLQWLGLPASRQTLAILRNVADPDLPRRLLEPLRSALWDPEILGTLAQSACLTDEQLTRACHALAA